MIRDKRFLRKYPGCAIVNDSVSYLDQSNQKEDSSYD